MIYYNSKLVLYYMKFGQDPYDTTDFLIVVYLKSKPLNEPALLKTKLQKRLRTYENKTTALISSELCTDPPPSYTYSNPPLCVQICGDVATLIAIV